MTAWDAETYGSRWFGIYDGLPWPAPDEAVDFLAKLAADGPALELAIGTGRLAIPLAQRGIDVHGIESSDEMIGKLHEKQGDLGIQVSKGDIGAFDTDREYSLIFLVLNSIYALQSQEEQISCFASAAAALRPGGHFVVEAFMPDPTRFRRNCWTQIHKIELDYVLIEADKHDPSTQRILEQHLHFHQGRVDLYPAFLRYIWPSEMDLMARLSGLRLVERYGGWNQEPFTASSGNNVSVYCRDEA